MATTTWRILGTTTLEPGQEKHWQWNNANLTSIYAFNVSPFLNPDDVGIMMIEVTEVRRTYNVNTKEQKVRVSFKNTGSVGGFAYIFMSEINGP
jgi:hypothetical protein